MTIEEGEQELQQKKEELNQINEEIKRKTEQLLQKEKELELLKVINDITSPELQHLFQGGILLNKENISEYINLDNRRAQIIGEEPWIYDPKGKYLYNLDGTLLFCDEIYNEDNETLRIPEGVTKIGKYCFSGSTYKTIKLPESVSCIEEQAFSHCRNLQKITMPGVKTIGKGTFEECYQLQTINCPNVINIEERAFYMCFNLKEIFLPQCTEIQKKVFKRCSALKKIYLPAIKKMGIECIRWNNKDGITLYLGNQLEEIDPNALQNDKIILYSSKETFENIKKKKRGGNRKYKGSEYDPIQNTPSKKEEFPKTKENIDFTAKKEKIQLEINNLNKEIDNLNNKAKELENTIKNERVVLAVLIRSKISQNFADTLSEILKKCTNIDKDIDHIETKDPYLLKALDTGSLRYHEETGCIYNKYGELIRYFGKDTSFTIPDGVTKIGDGAFNNSPIKEVIIPNSVKEIGESAFEGSNIEKLNFPEGIKRISPSTCKNCKNLERVNLPSTLEIIGESAFENCKSLQTLYIPNSVISIGDQAFCYTSMLQYLSIPPSVRYIGKNILDGTRLKKLILPKYCEKENRNKRENRGSVHDIIYDDELGKFQSTLTTLLSQGHPIKTTLQQDGTLSFSNNPQIIKKETFGEEAKQKTREINIPHSVQFIEEETFRGRTNLEKVQLSNSMGEIPGFLFRECNTLKEITLPEHLIRIDEQAFCECENLKEIDIPPTVNFIGEEAFYGCKKLKEIKVPKAILGQNIFLECSNLRTIKLPKEMFTSDNEIKKEYLINGNKDLSIDELKGYLGLDGKCNIILE